MAVKCLKKSNAIRESYEKHTFIADHGSVAPAVATRAVAQIEDASDTEESFDDEENGF